MSSNANCHHFDLKQSEGYQDFRANVPLKRISVDSDDPQKVRTLSYQIHTLYNVHVYFIFQAWKIFDCGSKEVTCPLVCIPPVSGSADIFYLQSIALSNKGYRVISVRDFYSNIIYEVNLVFHLCI